MKQKKYKIEKIKYPQKISATPKNTKKEKLVPNEKKQICKNCKYWHNLEEDYNMTSSTLNFEYMEYLTKIKECKRFPKTVRKHELDFCGEFKKK